MSATPKNLVRTGELNWDDGHHLRHPMQENAEVFWVSLSDRASMTRAHLNVARIPPGKSAFPLHSHAIQEEFVFILSGAGVARIADKEFEVGAGDYLGYPTDGTPHDIRNTGEEDMICLMGGERSVTEVATFPELGKVAVQGQGGMTFHDIKDGERRPFSDWLVKD